MALTERELREVEQVNASGRTPVVFVHGLWLLSKSWQPWTAVFEEAGYAPLAPGWPGDPETVEEARARPELLAGKSIRQIADHYAEAIARLDRKPAVIGHSFGGLLSEILAGRGLAAASVPISPVGFRGVLPVPLSALRAASPVVRNPANRRRAVMLTYDQFRYAFANALSEEEARRLYEEHSVPGAGRPIFQAVMANVDPRTEARVDTKTADRGPMLILSGDRDHTIPWSIANASFKKQRANNAVTEIARLDNRGHSLTFDSGWREVADRALAFVRRFAQS